MLDPRAEVLVIFSNGLGCIEKRFKVDIRRARMRDDIVVDIVIAIKAVSELIRWARLPSKQLQSSFFGLVRCGSS